MNTQYHHLTIFNPSLLPNSLALVSNTMPKSMNKSNTKSKLNHHHQNPTWFKFIFIFTKSALWNPHRKWLVFMREIERHHEIQTHKISEGKRLAKSKFWRGGSLENCMYDSSPFFNYFLLHFLPGSVVASLLSSIREMWKNREGAVLSVRLMWETERENYESLWFSVIE